MADKEILEVAYVEAHVDLTAKIDPDDIAVSLRNDSELFMFIWQLVQHDDVSLDVMERLYTELQEDLQERGIVGEDGKVIPDNMRESVREP